ncbi:MAG: hypothetical protein ACRDNF_19735 [Streptosporangiaceae bacterium]
MSTGRVVAVTLCGLVALVAGVYWVLGTYLTAAPGARDGAALVGVCAALVGVVVVFAPRGQH